MLGDRRRRRGRTRTSRSTRPRRRWPRAVAARGRQPNLSFFAFTATPKAQDAGAVRTRSTRRPGGTSRSTSTRCARRSRRASSSTCSPTTPPTRRTGTSRRRSPTTPSTTPAGAKAAIARFVTLHDINLAQKAEVDRRALPRHVAHRDRRAGQGDGRLLVPAARRALPPGARPSTSTTRATTSACSSRSPGTVDVDGERRSPRRS